MCEPFWLAMPTRDSRRVIRLRTLGQSPQTRKAKRTSATRVKGGSAEYYEQASHLPPGPRQPKEFASWPDELLKDLIGDNDRSGRHEGSSAASDRHAGRIRFRRLLNTLCGGLSVHTDFSGKQCPEHVLRMVGKSAASECNKASSQENAARHLLKDDTCPWLVCFRACDNSKLCRRVIMKGKHPPMHMQADMNIRLPKEASDELDKLRPDPKAPLAERVDAFVEMHKYLESNAEAFFGRTRVCPCLVHKGSNCPLGWQDVSDEHGTRPLTLSCAGTVCLPWSPYAKREGLGHMSTESWLIWVLEQKQLGMDLIAHENSEFFPLRLLTAALGRGYLIVSLAKPKVHIHLHMHRYTCISSVYIYIHIYMFVYVPKRKRNA